MRVRLRVIARNRARWAAVCIACQLLCAAVALAIPLAARPLAQSDLDTFMQRVLERRDANWRKLQQYILDEREQTEIRSPTGSPLWGERREYTWYIRDGFFVRSPVRVNGAAVGESDRVRYEQEFLQRERRREARAPASGEPPADGAATAGGPVDGPPDVDGLIRQSRQPQFITSAYFLRFRFDAGRYAFVGREQLDGREVLRIEYYPETLFTGNNRRNLRDDRERSGRATRERDDAEKSVDAELRRLMNKASKVTLWIEPTAHQIVRYTFDDLGWNFFPGQWLAQMDSVRASMTMGQPFEDVWLPRTLDVQVGLTLAVGTLEMRYRLDYENYRQADVRSRIEIPDRP